MNRPIVMDYHNVSDSHHANHANHGIASNHLHGGSKFLTLIKDRKGACGQTPSRCCFASTPALAAEAALAAANGCYFLTAFSLLGR